MKKLFFIWEGRFYRKYYFTLSEIYDKINIRYDRPILNSVGDMLTTEDLDF